MTANASHAPLRINDLKRHNAPLGSLLDAALSRVRESGYYILGPEVTQFVVVEVIDLDDLGLLLARPGHEHEIEDTYIALRDRVRQSRGDLPVELAPREFHDNDLDGSDRHVRLQLSWLDTP